MPGLHAGTVVFVGIAAMNVGNYLFHFVAARFLGPRPYGDLASLLALAGLIGLPIAGVQFAIARYVARFRAREEIGSIGALYRRSLAAGLVFGILLTVPLLAVAAPLQAGLGIGNLEAVILTALLAVPAVFTPIALGLAQGLQRFRLYSAALIAGAPVRVLLALLLLVAGFGVAGAIGATLAASVLTVVLPLAALRAWPAQGRGRPAPVPAREAAAALLPVSIGLLAITSLTTVDVIVAKAVLPDHAAGVYGGASLIGRVILYLPAAVVTVLLPKVSARSAVNRQTADILVRSLLATGAFCFIAVVLYSAFPGLIVSIALGGKFADASGLLWMFALAMTGYALLNVLLAYHIGRGRSGFSWLLAGGALLQLGGFWLFHGSPRELLVVTMTVAGALVVAHEFLIGGGLSRTAIDRLRLDSSRRPERL